MDQLWAELLAFQKMRTINAERTAPQIGFWELTKGFIEDGSCGHREARSQKFDRS
jgi:hypothetical protein